MIHETILGFIVIFSLFNLKFNDYKVKVNSLDFIATMFVFFAIISVILNPDNFYESAREYRHSYLVPLIMYIFLQTLFDNSKQLLILLFSIIPILFFSNILILPDVLLTGDRLSGKGMSSITLGFLATWSMLILLLTKKNIKSFTNKIISIFLIIFFFLVTFYQASRGVFVGVLFACITNFIVQKKESRKYIFIFVVSFLLVSFYIFMFIITKNFEPETFEKNSEYRSVESSYSRLFSIEHYENDINKRLELWTKSFNYGLDNPFLGKGLQSVQYSKIIRGFSTPHNVFISVFTSSGLVGTLLFIMMIVIFYSKILSLPNDNNFLEIKNFLMISVTVLLAIGSTNDFSGGRFAYFFILLSIASKSEKLVERDYN